MPSDVRGEREKKKKDRVSTTGSKTFVGTNSVVNYESSYELLRNRNQPACRKKGGIVTLKGLTVVISFSTQHSSLLGGGRLFFPRREELGGEGGGGKMKKEGGN